MSNETEQRNVVDELSVFAANGTVPDFKLDVVERCLYLELYDLYRRYRSKELSAEECKQKKASFVRAYNEERSRMDWYSGAMVKQGEFWKRVEFAGTQYAKSQDRTEAGDTFYNAVYGMMPVCRGEQNETPETEIESNQEGADIVD